MKTEEQIREMAEASHKRIDLTMKQGKTFEKDMLELLKFEEAGFKIKWAGYNRKQALKLRSRA